MTISYFEALDSVLSVLITNCAHQQVSIVISVSGLVVKHIVAVDVTWARFLADAFVAVSLCAGPSNGGSLRVSARGAPPPEGLHYVSEYLVFPTVGSPRRRS